MVHICYGNPRHRLVLDCSRFYSRDEIFRITRDKHKSAQLSLEYEDNLYQPIGCDVELRFACAMVEQYCASFQSEEDIQEFRNGLAETAHTLLTESRCKRKTKIKPDAGVDDDKKKNCIYVSTMSRI
jgi:hypothetical protein